jgi:hypothetical protein
MNKTLKLALKITSGFLIAFALAACALLTSGCSVNVIVAPHATMQVDSDNDTATRIQRAPVTPR